LACENGPNGLERWCLHHDLLSAKSILMSQTLMLSSRQSTYCDIQKCHNHHNRRKLYMSKSRAAAAATRALPYKYLPLPSPNPPPNTPQTPPHQAPTTTSPPFHTTPPRPPLRRRRQRRLPLLSLHLLPLPNPFRRALPPASRHRRLPRLQHHRAGLRLRCRLRRKQHGDPAGAGKDDEKGKRACAGGERGDGAE